MIESPLVSVIIPFYKVESYLNEAIDSVLQQTYARWEILLVDDGSPDGSTAIAKQYAADYSERIRYLHHPGRINKGLPAARNLGVKNAKGDWLALLDADDYWMPEKLEQQVAIACRFPEVGMICGASVYWYSWYDGEKEDVVIAVGGPQDVMIEPPGAAVTLYPLGKGAAPCPCSVMIKRDIAIQYGAFEEQFKGKFSLYEDQAFFIKVYLHETIYISSKAMDRYRQRHDSIMSQAGMNQDYHEVRYFYLKWLQQYLNKEKIMFPEVHRRLKDALLVYEENFLRKIKRRIEKYFSRIKG